MRLAAGTTPQPTMTSKLQLGEHIKTISGRKYIYSSKIRKRGGKAEQRYERPLDRKQQKTMEHLSKKDKGIIERAFQKGVAVSTIQDHVWHALGSRVAASTVYAYMTRHGVPREKRDVRIDKGKKRK
jgi:hypothetical protein